MVAMEGIVNCPNRMLNGSNGGVSRMLIGSYGANAHCANRMLNAELFR
jgi:hypothetical protein